MLAFNVVHFTGVRSVDIFINCIICVFFNIFLYSV